MGGNGMDDQYLIPKKEDPEPTERRPHRLTLNVGLAALALSLVALGFSGWQACEVQKSRLAAERSASAAEGSASEAGVLNNLTRQALDSAKIAANAAERSASSAAAQVDLVRQSASAARYANDLTQESIRGRVIETAAQFNKPVSIGDFPRATVDLVNAGHSEAVDVMGVVSLVLSTKLPDGEMPNAALERPPSIIVVGPGGHTNYEVTHILPVTAEEMRRLETDEMRFYVFGDVRYRSLGVEHRTTFCVIPNIKGTGARFCSKWNVAR
jgi:hypothetical protein